MIYCSCTGPLGLRSPTSTWRRGFTQVCVQSFCVRINSTGNVSNEQGIFFRAEWLPTSICLAAMTHQQHQLWQAIKGIFPWVILPPPWTASSFFCARLFCLLHFPELKLLCPLTHVESFLKDAECSACFVGLIGHKVFYVYN